MKQEEEKSTTAECLGDGFCSGHCAWFAGTSEELHDRRGNFIHEWSQSHCLYCISSSWPKYESTGCLWTFQSWLQERLGQGVRGKRRGVVRSHLHEAGGSGPGTSCLSGWSKRRAWEDAKRCWMRSPAGLCISGRSKEEWWILWEEMGLWLGKQKAGLNWVFKDLWVPSRGNVAGRWVF